MEGELFASTHPLQSAVCKISVSGNPVVYQTVIKLSRSNAELAHQNLSSFSLASALRPSKEMHLRFENGLIDVLSQAGSAY